MLIFLGVLLFLLGASFGSFLNVLVYRLPKGEDFLISRSFCPNCRNKLVWYDLIPVLSFLILKCRCRFCQKKISWQYPAVELISGLFFVSAIFWVNTAPEYILYLAVVSFFISLFVFDIKEYIIPDKISLPAIVVIAFLNIFFFGNALGIVLGGLIGGIWFLAQFLISKGRWVGGGDIRLGILGGVLLGHPLIWLSLMVAYIGGSIIALFMILVGKKKIGDKLPFATLLLPAFFVTWLWGDIIWAYYLNFIGF